MKKGVDFIGITIVYFCHDGKGNFVTMKRSNNTRDEHGRWDIGGGGLELHDSVVQTLKKEIKEEYSTDVIDFEFLGYRDVHRIHNETKTHWIALDFKVLIDPIKVAIGEPHKFEDLRWFAIKDLDSLPLNNFHSQFPEFLEKYRNKL